MACFFQRAGRTLSLLSPKILVRSRNPTPILHNHSRNYIAEMQKSAFETSILRILRTEIQYHYDYAPPKQPEKEFNSFVIEDCPGEQWFRLRRKYGEKEDIKVEVTMFDGAVPASKSGESNDIRLHISLIVDVVKGEAGGVLQFICSAWPDSLEIQKVFMLKSRQLRAKPYMGPDFVELEDELQEAMREFLEERGLNDELAVFLHEYVTNKDKTELIRWMGNVKSFIEK
ncbi:uncharacterized protein At2g39795, mitochondrial-like [Aristolochia californica]|uniref:uncharacterized protein At2g39795, mitochondrial-like n=1 Tax=Aristolochia californica TaxID=171875 RepID=UPI0035D8CEB8